MKLEELRLTHEYRKKLKEEQAERSEITRLARGERHLGIAALRIIPRVKLHWRVESALFRKIMA